MAREKKATDKIRWQYLVAIGLVIFALCPFSLSQPGFVFTISKENETVRQDVGEKRETITEVLAGGELRVRRVLKEETRGMFVDILKGGGLVAVGYIKLNSNPGWSDERMVQEFPRAVLLYGGNIKMYDLRAKITFTQGGELKPDFDRFWISSGDDIDFQGARFTVNRDDDLVRQTPLQQSLNLLRRFLWKFRYLLLLVFCCLSAIIARSGYKASMNRSTAKQSPNESDNSPSNLLTD